MYNLCIIIKIKQKKEPCNTFMQLGATCNMQHEKKIDFFFFFVCVSLVFCIIVNVVVVVVSHVTTGTVVIPFYAYWRAQLNKLSL